METLPPCSHAIAHHGAVDLDPSRSPADRRHALIASPGRPAGERSCTRQVDQKGRRGGGRRGRAGMPRGADVVPLPRRDGVQANAPSVGAPERVAVRHGRHLAAEDLAGDLPDRGRGRWGLSVERRNGCRDAGRRGSREQPDRSSPHSVPPATAWPSYERSADARTIAPAPTLRQPRASFPRPLTA